MSLLDRHIARQYLFNVVALTMLLFSFIVAIDLALNLDRFIQTASKLATDTGPGAARVGRAVLLAWDLWWPRLLQLSSYLNGLVLVGAMGFTLTQLVRHRELVAMMAGGISLTRVARPILMVALLAIGVQALNQEFVLPRIAHLLPRDPGDAGKQDWNEFDVRLVKDSSSRLFYAKKFEPDAGRLTGVIVWERDEKGRAVKRITATSAVWRAGGWDLENGSAESLALSAGGASRSGGTSQGMVRIETDLDPTMLLMKKYASLSQSLSWSQISELRKSPLAEVAPASKAEPLKERLDRARFGRLSVMVSTILSLIIAMPFFLVREPKNMVWQSVQCAPIAIGALVGGSLGASAAIPGVPAALAVFLPVLVLLPVAIGMGSSIKT